jgi:6-phosphofructokinase 1
METLPLRKRTRLSSEKEPQTLLNPEDMAHQTKAKRLSFGTSLSEDVDGALDGVGKSVAVLTSGGDSQGMNSALRAIVRLSLHHGMRVYAVHEGYQGLVDGGEKGMEECSWNSVSNILHKGGTVIGTARCRDFREREGRLRAAANLVKRGIGNLVVIGGDGSLTGASVFKEEWTGLLAELQQEQRITAEEAAKCRFLNIVGLVGSIDNDMCGTDMTIGTDSALHRIIEAIDCLTSTAASHQRSFVLEVMGRHCGYLALMAGIAGCVDAVFIPERPPNPGWEDSMCYQIAQCRDAGRRHSLVIVSEGAVDSENRPITSEKIRDILQARLGHDTRITVLGHVQRGGKPSAYDRIISARMGAAAVITLLNAEGEIPPKMIGVQGNVIMQLPLMDCVKKTRAIDTAMKTCEFKQALELRGRSFKRNMELLRRLESCRNPECGSEEEILSPTPVRRFRFAIMNVGAPAAGMNSCNRACIRLLLYKGHTVLGVGNGFSGLLDDDITEMSWDSVTNWAAEGGSNLGTNRIKPTAHTLPEIAAKFGEHHIEGLLIVGGFEAYHSLIILEENRKLYTAFRIPLLGVAATISNNVPGTEYSLGCDTALNTIVSSCDILRQSAQANRKRVFVIETMGGYCGYLATMAALAGGADAAYIFEEKFTISDIQRDAGYLVGKFKDGLERGLLLRNEKCNENFTTTFITELLSEQGKGVFICRDSILGHLQQGDAPTPYDRILGVQYAAHTVDFLQKHAQENLNSRDKVRAENAESACMMGLQGTKFQAIPLQKLAKETDFEHRIPMHQWWMSLRPLIAIFAKHKEHDFRGETR